MQTQCNENKTNETKHFDAVDQLREGEGKLTPLVGIDCVLSDGPVQQIFLQIKEITRMGQPLTV